MDFYSAQEIISKEIEEMTKQINENAKKQGDKFYKTSEYYLYEKYNSAFHMVEEPNDMHLLSIHEDSPYTHHISQSKLRKRFKELMGEERFNRLKFIAK
jgi:hypothetical protein